MRQEMGAIGRWLADRGYSIHDWNKDGFLLFKGAIEARQPPADVSERFARWRSLHDHRMAHYRGATIAEIQTLNQRLAEKGYSRLDGEQEEALCLGGRQADALLDDLQARVGILTDDIDAAMSGEDPVPEKRITMARPESRGGDVEVDAFRVGDTLTIKNGFGYSTVTQNRDGTYTVDSGCELGMSPEEAAEMKAARTQRSARAAAAQARADTDVAAAGDDPVRVALTKMAHGEHPEKALAKMADADVRAVAKAMGSPAGPKATTGAIIERIGEQARSEWIAQSKAAVQAAFKPWPLNDSSPLPDEDQDEADEQRPGLR